MKIKLILMVIMAILLMAVPLAACSSSNPTPAVTVAAQAQTTASPAKPAVFRIGVMGQMTGAGAAPVTSLFDYYNFMFKYINEVEGGIDGVKLEWKIVDDKGTPEGGILAYRELRESFKPQVYVVVGEHLYIGIKNMVEEDRAVIISTAAFIPTLFNPPGRYFSLSIPTADEFAAFVRWVTQDWKGEGKPKVGVLHWSDMASGKAWQVAQPWVQNQGIDILPVPYSIATMDLKPQLMSLRDGGANYVWMFAITGNAAVAVRDMNALGLTDKIKLVFCNYVESDVLVGLSGKAVAGFYSVKDQSPFSDGSSAARMFTDIQEWAGKKAAWADNRQQLTLKAVLTAAIKQAAADVGKDKIDSDAFYNALNKLESIDTWGNCQNFGFGPDRRIGLQTMKITRFTETGTVSASDWITLPRIFEGIEK